MGPILSFEADRRSLNITINSFGTSLSKEQRAGLFPSLGRLYPEGNMALARADDVDQVKAVLDNVVEYRGFLESSAGGGGGAADSAGGHGGAASLEDHFFQYEVGLNKMAFLQQFQYGVFYSFFKLKEQEIRSLTWIAECEFAGHVSRRIASELMNPCFTKPNRHRSKCARASQVSRCVECEADREADLSSSLRHFHAPSVHTVISE